MEQDLRTLLTSVRDGAPPPRLSVDDITAAGRHLARRRRLTLLSSVGGSAAAAVAAVTAALVIAGTPAALTPAVDPSTLPNAVSPAPTAFADAEPFVTTYNGYAAGSYLVSDPDLVTMAYQQSSIDAGIDLSAEPLSSPPLPATTVPAAGLSRMPGLLRGGILVVYRPGAFDPTEFLKSAEKVEVRTGFGLLRNAGGSGQPTPSPPDRARLQKMQAQIPSLAWQYAKNAWAVIYWSSWESLPTKEELAAIADGLRPSATKQFPVGFLPSFVPHGFQLLSVSYGTDMGTGNQVVSAARLSPGLPTLPLTQPIDLQGFPTLTLSFGRTNAGPRMVDKLDCTSGVQCQRVLGDGTTYVKAELNGLKTTAQVTQITLGIRPQNADNMADWPPAVKVFP
ncbi:hypothetical protein [Dactylosporangium sp. NPDC048998]|uniref:hypothetical protein n=1 Tax=Dactylosporangium sp. NPDC048998 TaxID=3363976 RepID=UPI003720D859